MDHGLNSLPLRQKIGQLFFIGIAGPTLDAPTRELFDDVQPGGICLFARNIKDAVQTRELLEEIRQILPFTPFLSLDQEGGLVDRLRRILTPMPAANKINTKEDARKLGRFIAESTRMLGFNTDFAPVVDVIDNTREKDSNGLFSRAFGTNAAESSELAGEFLNELQAGGILGCLKHFPGLGAATVDSHEELPLVDITDDELENTDLAPYRKLLANDDVAFVMAAHSTFPQSRLQETDASGKLKPSSLSNNFITKLLRDELGFHGIAITDDLEMGAIVKNYGIGTACVMAVDAGQDMLAICADPVNIRDGRDAVLRAVESGSISESRIDESLERINLVRDRLSDPTKLDIARLAEISAEIAEFYTFLTR